MHFGTTRSRISPRDKPRHHQCIRACAPRTTPRAPTGCNCCSARVRVSKPALPMTTPQAQLAGFGTRSPHIVTAQGSPAQVGCASSSPCHSLVLPRSCTWFGRDGGCVSIQHGRARCVLCLTYMHREFVASFVVDSRVRARWQVLTPRSSAARRGVGR